MICLDDVTIDNRIGDLKCFYAQANQAPINHVIFL